MLMLRARSTLEFSMSATALTGAAFGADAACAGANDFVAAAHRTGDSHEDAPKSDHDPVGVTVSISVAALVRAPVLDGVGQIVCNHVDHLFVARARQIRYGPVERFLFDLDNFLKRQVRLPPVRRSRFLVAFDELAGEPAENVMSDACRMSNVRILCKTAGLESLVGEFFHQTLERHAVLERNRSECTDGIH